MFQKQPYELLCELTRKFPMLLKTLIVGLLIAIAEVVNGNFRVRYLQKKYGIKGAKKISFISGIIIIYSISWFTLAWVEPTNHVDCLIIGSIWLIIMLSLDIFFGKYVFKMKWHSIIDDFNIMKGNWLGVGMVFLFICPTIVFLIIK